MFTQSLDVLRLPGQVLDGKPPAIANDNKSIADASAATVKNSAGPTVTDMSPESGQTGLASLPASVSQAAAAFAAPTSLQAASGQLTALNAGATNALTAGANAITANALVAGATSAITGAVGAVSAGATNLVSGATNAIAGAVGQLPSLSGAAFLAKAASIVSPAIAQFKSIDFTAIQASAKNGALLSSFTPTPGSAETLADILAKLPPPQPVALPPIPPLDPSLALNIKATADKLKLAIPKIPIPGFGDKLTGLADMASNSAGQITNLANTAISGANSVAGAISGASNLTSNLPTASGVVAKFI